MRTRFAATFAALALVLAVPATSAMAQYDDPGHGRSPFSAGFHDEYAEPTYDRCAPSSAAEGNANQQTRPVKQYGQTSGGTRC